MWKTLELGRDSVGVEGKIIGVEQNIEIVDRNIESERQQNIDVS
jgi:hypothetical protein